jgi:hypothetical protein
MPTPLPPLPVAHRPQLGGACRSYAREGQLVKVEIGPGCPQAQGLHVYQLSGNAEAFFTRLHQYANCCPGPCCGNVRGCTRPLLVYGHRGVQSVSKQHQGMAPLTAI